MNKQRLALQGFSIWKIFNKKTLVGSIAAKFFTLFMIFLFIVSSVSYAVLANPAIWTTDEFGVEKSDFSPGDVVYIQGEGFNPSATLDVDITRPDSTVDSAPGGPFPSELPTTDENGAFSDYTYDLDGVEGLYTITASDGINDPAETTFTDTAAIYSIIIENPAPGSIVLNPVRVSGTWGVLHAQGQLSDYNVQIVWGDGTTTDAVNIVRNEEGSGNDKHYWGTFDTYPGFDHTYSSALLCGEVTLIAKLYHAEPPGTESGDASASVTISPGISEDCDNLIDDDCDTYVDCDDSDCDNTQECGECTADADCDDGAYCNGVETCNLATYQCESGAPIDCDDGVDCTDDICNEDTNSCDYEPNDALCPADTVCADYYCSATLDCQVNYKPDATICRVAAGVCDIAETCTGSSATCPADAKSTAECRAAAGVCDVAEVCDGINNDCPVDSFKSSTIECRAAAGVCDLAETCTGSSAACPADAKSTAECRAVAGVCDVAEVCDGINNDCPNNFFKPLSTDCGICAHCDGAGSCVYDEMQDSDCTATSCPDACNLDANILTWDYAADVPNECVAINTCSNYACSYSHECSFSLCSAQCDATNDCKGNSCEATYDDYCSDYKLTEYDSDKIQDSTTVTDSCDNTCQADCTCTDCAVDCSAPQTNTYCVKGVCGAECDSNDDCDDLNPYTVDTCLENCICGDQVLECLNDIDCDDKNVCTDDSCNLGTNTCEYTNNNDPCDDGDACTTSDTCSAGSCVGGAPLDCNDGNVCTDDSCNPLSGCVYTPNTAPCNDGDLCTLNDQCAQGSCVRGAPKDCSGLDDQCQVGVCDPSDGQCYPDYNNYPLSTPCEADQDLCTLDHCDGAGSCVWLSDVPVPDDTQCASYKCNPSTGLVETTYYPLSTPCEADGDLCTIDHCDGAGSCVTYDNVVVPEDDQCTSYYCDPIDGQIKEDYTNYPLSTPCEADQDLCTIDHCDGNGVCVKYYDTDCGYLSDQCNVGMCDAGTGDCYAEPLPDGTSCDDELYCNGNEVCVSGLCTAGTPIDCSALDTECSEGICDEERDSCEAVSVDDTTGPVTSNLLVIPYKNNGVFDLSATATDGCSNIERSEYFVGHIANANCGSPETGTAMEASDGSFDGLIEDVKKDNINYLVDGLNWVCVQSKDSAQNWGNCVCAYFESDTLPPSCVFDIKLDDVLDPYEYLICGDNPTLTAKVCDSQSDIQGGEYFFDLVLPPIPEPWTGYWMDVNYSYEQSGLQCAQISAVVNTSSLEDGTHTIRVRGKDSLENWGKLNGCDVVSFIKDTTAPDTTKVVDEVKVTCGYDWDGGNNVEECYYIKQGTAIHLSAVDPDPQQTGEFAGLDKIMCQFRWKLNWEDPWGNCI